MILLNHGLTEAEREKVMNPYSPNHMGRELDYEHMGKEIADFVDEHSDLLLQAAAMLDKAQNSPKEKK